MDIQLFSSQFYGVLEDGIRFLQPTFFMYFEKLHTPTNSSLPSAFKNYSASAVSQLFKMALNGNNTNKKAILSVLASYLAKHSKDFAKIERETGNNLPCIIQLMDNVEEEVEAIKRGKADIVSFALLSELRNDSRFDLNMIMTSYVDNLVIEEANKSYLMLKENSVIDIIQMAIKFDLPNPVFLVLLDGIKSKLLLETYSSLFRLAKGFSQTFKVQSKIDLLNNSQLPNSNSTNVPIRSSRRIFTVSDFDDKCFHVFRMEFVFGYY